MPALNILVPGLNGLGPTAGQRDSVNRTDTRDKKPTIAGIRIRAELGIRSKVFDLVNGPNGERNASEIAANCPVRTLVNRFKHETK